MKHNKRGQAALEFLTTYGWAFLVIILVVGGLAYFNVFDITSRLPDGCTMEGQSFTCGDIFQVNSAGTYTLQIRNNLNRQVQIDTIEIIERSLNDGTYANSCEDATGYTINPGIQVEQQFDATVGNCGLTENSGQKKIFDFRFNYTQQGSSIVNIAQGSVTTTVI